MIECSQNTAPNSYKYLLTIIIDTWSQYAWLIHLKNKQAHILETIFTTWLDENKDETNPYRVFMSDQGGERSELSLLSEIHDIQYTQSSVPQCNGIVEMLNQTIRRCQRTC